MIKVFLRKIDWKDKFLLCANIGISSFLGGVGDILEQQYEIMLHEINSWNPRRTRNMAVSGGVSGIICHYWYTFLDKKIPGRNLRAVSKKILADQLVCSPINISLFLATLAILENESYTTFKDSARKKFWTLYWADWFVWPFAQFINFSILPLRYRVLYDNTISLCFDVYTSQVVERRKIKIEIIEHKDTQQLDNKKL